MFLVEGIEIFPIREFLLIILFLIFKVSSTPQINAEIYKNLKLADKVFEIIPEQRKMLLTDVVSFLIFGSF